jgi:hypothetical protein
LTQTRASAFRPPGHADAPSYPRTPFRQTLLEHEQQQLELFLLALRQRPLVVVEIDANDRAHGSVEPAPAADRGVAGRGERAGAGERRRAGDVGARALDNTVGGERTRADEVGRRGLSAYPSAVPVEAPVRAAAAKRTRVPSVVSVPLP